MFLKLQHSATRVTAALFASTGLFVTSAFGQNAPDPGLYLPGETSVVMTVRDLSVFADLEEDHPVRSFLAHPGVRHIFGEFLDDAEGMLDEETSKDLGIDEEELARLFPGLFMVGAYFDISALMNPPAVDGNGDQTEARMGLNINLEEALGGVAILDTTATDERIFELMENLGNHVAENSDDLEEARTIRDELDGKKIIRTEMKPVDGDWQTITGCLLDGKLVVNFTPNENYYRDVLRRVEGGGKESGSMANETGYLDARDRLTESDFFVFAPLTGMMAAIEEALRDAYEKMGEQAQAGGGMNPAMMIPIDNIVNVIGFKDFRRMTLAGKLQPDGIEFVQEIAFNERSGMISNMINYGDGGIELPDVDSAGLKSFSVSSFNLGKMVNTMIKATHQISPMVGGMVDMQLAQLENQGLKLRTGILPAIGDELISMEMYANPDPPEDQLPSQVFMVKAEDPTGMEAALEEMKGYMSTMTGAEDSEPREFMGVTVNELSGIGEALGQMFPTVDDPSTAYSFVDDYLVITLGEPDMMNHLIASLKKKGNDLESFEVVGESWRRWDDANLVSFTYQDIATLMRTFIYGSEDGLEVQAEIDGDDVALDRVGEGIDDMPSLEDMNYYLIDKTYQTEEALVSRGFFGRKPE